MGKIEIRHDASKRGNVVLKRSSDARKEYEILSSLDSPRIVKPSGLDADGLLLPEYVEKAADGIAGYCSEKEAWRFIRDVSEGLAYLHGKGLVHHDIKPSNILIGPDGYVISDFDNEGDETSYAFTPPEWTADRKNMTSASDIWSLGASVFNLLNGSYIFSGKGGTVQKRETLIPRLSYRYSTEMSDVIFRCLSFEPADRPSAEELLRISRDMAGKKKVRPSGKNPLACTDKYEHVHEALWPEQMKDSD